MRVLFTVSSWPTHYATMVPLGWALQAAGHEVRVLCAPSQIEPVTVTGLIPVPVLGGMEPVVSNRLQYYWEAVHGLWPYPWLPPHPVTGAPLNRLDEFDLRDYRENLEPAFAAQARDSFDRAVEFARAWRPDLVLHDPASLAGPLVAGVLAVPAALCLWGPAGTHEEEHMRIIPTDLSGSFPRYGLGELSPDLIRRVIDPCPAAVAPQLKAQRLPMRYVPYNGCAPAPAWVLDPPTRPRVCVVWSTALSTMSGPNSYALPTIIRGLAGLGYELIVTATARDVAALGEVPPEVRVAERLPLRLLLPTCAAVVHHGGGGNTLTSLWSAVPQLVLTFASEQTVNGQRVAAAGAGLHSLGHLADDLRIRAMVEELVAEPAYRTTAAELRADMLRQPTPAELVESLADLAVAR